MATSVARRSPSGPIIRMYAQEIGRIPADPYGAAVSVGPGGRPPGTPRSPLRAEAARAAVAPRSPLRAEAAGAAEAPRSPLRAEAAGAAATGPASLAASSPAAA